MQNLTLHPTCQDRLREELRETLPSNSLDRNFAVIDKLTYLNATVMEALRVVTTIETYQPRVVPACGCSIEGYHIPWRHDRLITTLFNEQSPGRFSIALDF